MYFEIPANPQPGSREVRALPRARLDQDFAVLLMRSSYAVADELDFMPMDAFQQEPETDRTLS